MLKRITKNVLSIAGYEIHRKANCLVAPGGKGGRFWPEPNAVAQTLYETDDRFHTLYEHAQVKTQMAKSDNPLRRQRHYTLNHLLWCANTSSGDVAELGCWRGLSTYQIASYLKDKSKNSLFHVFDSFEGLSELGRMDIPIDRTQNNEVVRKHFACSLEVVKENLKEFDFIKYYQGWIPNRFDEVADKRFSFVHIDVDLYQPIYDSFQYFFPRLCRHGIMVFDDYGCSQFPGAKKAVDECLEMNDKCFFVTLPSGQAFLVKGI